MSKNSKINASNNHDEMRKLLIKINEAFGASIFHERDEQMDFFVNIQGMSLSGLIELHELISNRLKNEDELRENQEKSYGVREYNDWRSMSDKIENELDRRGEKYKKINWG